MPRIPTSQNNSVQQQAFSSRGFNVEAKAPVGNADVLNAAANVLDKGTVIANKMAEAKQRANQTMIQSHENDATLLADEHYWNKDTGFVNKRGQEANTAYDEYVKNYEDALEQSASKLGSVELQEQARYKNQEYVSKYKTRLSKQIFEQNEKFEVEEAGRSLQILQDTAVNNYDTDQPVESINKMRTLIYGDPEKGIVGYDKTMNLTPEQAKALERKHTSGVVRGVITSYLNNGKINQANIEFERAKESGIVDSETNEFLSNKLRAENERNKVQTYAAQIMSENLPLGESVEKARKNIEDPSVKVAVVSELKLRHEEKKKFEFEADEAKMGKYIEQLQIMRNTKGIPADELNALPEKRKRVLNNLLEIIAKGKHSPDTDPIVYNDLMRLAGTPSTREQFLETSINDYADRLSNEHRMKFIDMQKNLASGSGSVGKHDADLGQFMSDVQTMNSVMKPLGINPKSDDADEVRRKVQERVIDWQRKNNVKNAPQDVVEKITNDLVTEVVLEERVFFVPDKRKRKFKVEFDDIPEKDVAKIKAFLGPNYTEKAALEQYLNKLEGSK